MNPWKEGNYLCYGEAVELGEGHFAAYYFVEHTSPSGERRCVLERRRFGNQTYKTADLARVTAVSAGRQWVLSQST